ncbi:hypothetical protein PI125_g14553 [Phytophthora idaei]|nr:hypothetical protein PI125_g14553 [Phytophthora idaei]
MARQQTTTFMRFHARKLLSIVILPCNKAACMRADEL